MSLDYTQQQTVGEQMRAEELSLRAVVPPTQLPGYRLDSLLGQGAFGQVWVGTDLNTGRPVAVKFYLHRSGVNWSLLAREVKNLVSMSANRFIVQVLDVGWDAEPPYYVMEYLENGSLDDLLKQNGAMTVDRAVEIFTDIALGLNHSHGKGVLHCDLKPANVLLDQDMRPRLADFGQSRLSHEQTPSLGTLFYMAPEQADLNALPDARWDVYAIGAILHCMLTGSPPYRTPQTVSDLDTSANLTDRLARYRETIMKSYAPRAHHRIPGIDRALVNIVDRCLAKRPSDRYGNVQQVIQAIERRQAARVRRPTVLLGIFVPLVLVSIMALFANRGISIAVNDARREIRELALERNEKNASYAASALEAEMGRLFGLLESEASKSQFSTLFTTFESAAGKDLLSGLATESPDPELLDKLLSIPERTELEGYLQDRFRQILAETRVHNESARFSSLFVTDRYGNLVATALSDSPESNRVGWNFAYRSYFSGQRQDSPVTVPRRNIGPTSVSHVSVPFKSTTNQRWKIAVCTPILIDDSVEGVMVLTINLGDFELLANRDNNRDSEESKEKSKESGGDKSKPSDKSKSADKSKSNDKSKSAEKSKKVKSGDVKSEDPVRSDVKNESDQVLAVLVDGHEGPREGTILQHPMLKNLSHRVGDNAELATLTFQLSDEQMKELQERGSFSYQDPVAKHPLGREYDGDWIATMKRVDVSRRIRQTDATERKYSTDLWVLVQERTDLADAPVARLAQKLSREGGFALLLIIGLIAALWYFVLRILRLPDQSMNVAKIKKNPEQIGTATHDPTLDASA